MILRGTADQVALAEWLFNELDKPANRQALAQQKQGSAIHEYRLSGGTDNVARVFYLTHIETPQDLVELATTVRTIGDIRRLYSHNALGAVVVRGTADQVALAEWLFNELDKPANRQTDAQQYQDSATYAYRAPEGGDDTAVRVFYLTHAPTVQRLLEIATQLRRETGVRRLYSYSALKALALRGSPDQLLQVARLIKAQDR